MDQFDFNDNESKRAGGAVGRLSRLIWSLGAVYFLCMAAFLVGFFALTFINPNHPYNPWPPVPTQAAATAMPSATPVTPTNTATATEEPTATATEAPTDTPASAATATSGDPMVSVSTNTNCRYGPGNVYEPPIGALLTGEEAKVVGVPASSIDYIVIDNPDGGEDCWLWTRYATITGDLSGLPKYSIPATPTPVPTDTPTPAGPVFTISYKNVHTCGANESATVSIFNTGSVIFESAKIVVDDIDASSTLYSGSSNSPFVTNAGGCPPGGSQLEPGDNAYIVVPIGAAPPSGHDAKYSVQMCTEDGLAGDCVTRSLTFTIP